MPRPVTAMQPRIVVGGRWLRAAWLCLKLRRLIPASCMSILVMVPAVRGTGEAIAARAAGGLLRPASR